MLVLLATMILSPHTRCLERVDLVMRSAVPGLPPPAPAPNSFTGEAVDHLGIPLLGLRPRVAEPELITLPPPG